MPKIPQYRRRKDRSQALVTLTDARTKRRRDYWLGEYGTPGSWQEYHRVLAACPTSRAIAPRTARR